MDNGTDKPTRRDFVRMALTYAGVFPVAALLQRCVANVSNAGGRHAAAHKDRRVPRIGPPR